MSALPQPAPLSATEYLEHEKDSVVRHEYLAGQIFAMAGASEAHNTLALNLAAELRARLRGGPCRVFISDMKVRVRSAETFYYPDVFVTCSAEDKDPYFKERPSVIFEVLSPGTEATDRREKLLVYSQLASLREYVLVSQEERRVELHARAEEAALWQTTRLSETGTLRLASLDIDLGLDEIYADARLLS